MASTVVRAGVVRSTANVAANVVVPPPPCELARSAAGKSSLFGWLAAGAASAALGAAVYLRPYTTCQQEDAFLASSSSSSSSSSQSSKGAFVTAAGVRLQSYEWEPPAASSGLGEPLAVVFLLHGLHEHLGRHEEIAEVLARNNFFVCGVDHQGHGRSQGLPGYVESFDHFVSDYLEYVRHVLDTRPGLDRLPKFLVGHSMGGLISLHLALRQPELWSGVVLSGPAIVPAPEVAHPVLQSASRTLSQLLPKLPLIKLDLQALSERPEIIAEAQADPLYNSAGVCIRTGAELLRAMHVVQQSFQHIHLPLLVLHGEHDTLVLPEGSHLLVDRAASADKTLHIIKNVRHELFNSSVRDSIFQTVVAWLATRCKQIDSCSESEDDDLLSAVHRR